MRLQFVRFTIQRGLIAAYLCIPSERLLAIVPERVMSVYTKGYILQTVIGSRQHPRITQEEPLGWTRPQEHVVMRTKPSLSFYPQ